MISSAPRPSAIDDANANATPPNNTTAPATLRGERALTRADAVNGSRGHPSTCLYHIGAGKRWVALPCLDSQQILVSLDDTPYYRRVAPRFSVSVPRGDADERERCSGRASSTEMDRETLTAICRVTGKRAPLGC